MPNLKNLDVMPKLNPNHKNPELMPKLNLKHLEISRLEELRNLTFEKHG